jgi:hypothetical protein
MGRPGSQLGVRDESMGRSRKPSYARLESALRAARGVVLHAARSLGVERAELRKWIEEDHKLQKLSAEITQELLDLSEHQLRKKVAAGNVKAIEFTRRFYVPHTPSPKLEPLEPWEVAILKELFDARGRQAPKED